MEHWSVAIEHRIVKLVRTSTPLTTVSDVAESFEEIGGTVAKLPTRSWGLVLDMRQARPAPNREIEHALRTHQKEITAMFARHATLLATAAA